MTVSAQNPSNTYTGNGSVTVYPYTFYISDVDQMQVYLDGVLQPTSGVYTIGSIGMESGGDITFIAAPANDVVVKFQRFLVLERDTSYTQGSAIRSTTLNDDLDAVVLMMQDLNSVSFKITGSNDVDANGGRIINVGTAINDDDAVSKIYVENEFGDVADAAAASAAAALVSENNAALSEGNASDFEDKAQMWATEAEDTEVEPGEYSAYHWAKKSEATSGDVASVNGYTGIVTLDHTDVGAVASTGGIFTGDVEAPGFNAFINTDTRYVQLAKALGSFVSLSIQNVSNGLNILPIMTAGDGLATTLYDNSSVGNEGPTLSTSYLGIDVGTAFSSGTSAVRIGVGQDPGVGLAVVPDSNQGGLYQLDVAGGFESIIFLFQEDGGFYTYYDGTVKTETTTAGLTVHGGLTTTTGISCTGKGSFTPSGTAEVPLQTQGLAGQTNHLFRCLNSAGTAIAYVTNLGAVVGTGIIDISDSKTKHDVEETSEGLAKIKQVTSKKFKRNNQTRNELGFIAQDLEQIFPEMVVDTVINDEGETQKGIMSLQLLPVIVNALKEIDARLDTLEKKKNASSPNNGK